MAEPQLQDFDIITPDGRTYTVQNSTPEKAQKIADEINRRVAAGDDQLLNGQFDDDVQIQRPGGQPQVPADAAFEADNSMKPGVMGTFFNRLASAGPLNWGDEIAAAGNAAIPGMASLDNFVSDLTGNPSPPQQSMWSEGATGFWDAFGKNHQALNTMLRVGQETNPRADAAGNIIGAVAGAKGAGMVGRGLLNTAARVAPSAVIPTVGAIEAQAIAHPVKAATGQALATGVPAGYIAGYGGGDTQENRERGAGTGAFVGAALAPVIGAGSATILPRVRQLWDAFRGRGSEDEALMQIVQTLQRDGYDMASPSGVLELKHALSEFTNKPVTIADIGRATRQRTQEAISTPNPGQQDAIAKLAARQEGTGPRIEQSIQESVLPNMPLGPQPLNVFSHADELAASRAGNAEALKPPALYERTMTPPNMAPVAYEPPLPVPAPAVRGYDEPVTVAGQPSLDLQFPAPAPPVRTVRDPAGGVERTLGYDVPRGTAPPPITPDPYQGLRNMLGGSPSLRSGPQALDRNFIESMQANEQAVIQAEQAAAAEARATHRANADAYRAQREARQMELAQMDAEQRAIAEAADKKEAAELAFHNNAQQGELPLDQFGRRRGVDVAGPPAPTFNPKSPRMVEDPVANRIISDDPLAQRALAEAVKLSQVERASLLARGENADHIPEILAGQPLDYRTADYLQRSMAQQINAAYSGQGSFSVAEANMLKNTRNDLMARLKAENQEYGRYIDTYADESQAIKSLEEGQQYKNLQPEQIAAGQAERTGPAQDLYRIGAARSMVEDVRGATTGTSAAGRVANSPEQISQIEALGLPGGNAEDLLRSIEQERTLNLLPAGVNPKFLPQDSASVLEAAGNIYNPTSSVSVIRAMTAPIVNRIKVLRGEKVNEALLSKVLTLDKAAQDDIILQLQQTGERQKADHLRRVLRARNAGLATGLAIGGPVSLQEE